MLIRYPSQVQMSLSVYNEFDHWKVNGIMGTRVQGFVSEVGRALADSPQRRAWLDAWDGWSKEFGTDFHTRDVVNSADQAEFLCAVLHEVANRIYDRRLGDQSDQNWQAWTIWAVLDLHEVLRRVASRLRAGSAG